MAKTSRIQIKADEGELMKILFSNADIRIDDMAKKMKFSRQKAWRLIKRLEENKTILGQHAIIDMKKIGFTKYILLISLSCDYKDGIVGKQFMKDLATIGNKGGLINTFSFCNGGHDFILSFYAPDIKTAVHYRQGIEKIVFKGQIKRMQMLEEVVPIMENGIDLPGAKDIEEFL